MKKARAPLLLDLSEGRVALVALTENEPDWEATGPRPGVSYVGYGDCGLKQPYRSQLAQVLLSARTLVRTGVRTSHRLIDMGMTLSRS